MIAHSVSRATQEIGIRIAIGANTADAKAALGCSSRGAGLKCAKKPVHEICIRENRQFVDHSSKICGVTCSRRWDPDSPVQSRKRQ
jgi:hypothetical protein